MKEYPSAEKCHDIIIRMQDLLVEIRSEVEKPSVRGIQYALSKIDGISIDLCSDLTEHVELLYNEYTLDLERWRNDHTDSAN